MRLLRNGLLVALMGLALPLGATQVTMHEAPCPLDAKITRVYEKISANKEGGWDSDLCDYSTQGQWREFAIATCAHDLYSVKSEDFDTPLDPESLARVNAVSMQLLAEYPDPAAIRVWDRYVMAARFYEALGRDKAFVGDLYLAASWTARDQAVGVYEGLQGPGMAFQVLEDGARELEKPLSIAQRKMVLYNLARVAQRAGESTLRDRYLDLFEASGGLDAEEQASLARFRSMSHDVEPRLQDKAIDAFAAFLMTPGIDHGEQVRSAYLLADLFRRRGRLVEAVPLFTVVANDAQADQQLRELSLFFARRLADQLDTQPSR